MKKALIWIASFILILTSGINPVKANEHDERVAKMRVVLTKYNSPMVGLEDTMIRTAEKYGLDWTLLAAIAGTESSFAKRMPYQCNNPTAGVSTAPTNSVLPHSKTRSRAWPLA